MQRMPAGNLGESRALHKSSKKKKTPVHTKIFFFPVLSLNFSAHSPRNTKLSSWKTLLSCPTERPLTDIRLESHIHSSVTLFAIIQKSHTILSTRRQWWAWKSVRQHSLCVLTSYNPIWTVTTNTHTTCGISLCAGTAVTFAYVQAPNSWARV